MPDRFGWHERPTDQSVGTELGQPGRVGHIGLAARQVLHMPGVDQHHLEPSIFQQVVERLPVVPRRLHHHTGHLLSDQVLTQRQDLARHRTPSGDRLHGLPPTSARNPDTDLGVLLGHVQASTPHVYDFHHDHPLPNRRTTTLSVAERAGRFRKSDARARRHQSTVPVAPSTTMLTYRLTGTTEDSGSTATNPTSLPP